MTGSLEEYVAAIELAFTRRSGREHVLSPRDFALARGWHAAGVRVSVVLEELEASGPSGARSLAFVQRRVEQRAQQGRAPGRSRSAD